MTTPVTGGIGDTRSDKSEPKKFMVGFLLYRGGVALTQSAVSCMADLQVTAHGVLDPCDR